MTSMQRSPATGRTGGAAPDGRRPLKFAWISVALIPVAFIAAMFIGEGLLTLQGFDPEAEEFPPLGVALRAAIPAGLVMIAPAVAAVVFGFRARKRGAGTGIVPAVIGIVVIAYGLVANTLPWLLGGVGSTIPIRNVRKVYLMNVLVAYASRHGATAGIAERIAAGLRSAGLQTDVKSVTDVRDVTAYDAFVIGGAAYMFHWLKDATAFVKRHRATLAGRPVWLFSSGPLGTDLVDKEGRDVLETGRPKEFEASRPCSGHVDERVFFGAWDPTAPPIGVA